MWAFHKLYKKKSQTTEGRRKKETHISNCKHRKVKLALFRILCLFMAFVRTLRKSNTATKMLTHLVIVLTFQLPTDRPGVSLLTDSLLLIDSYGVPLVTDLRPSFFSSGHAGFRGHRSLCGLRANIDKERFCGHSTAASKMQEMRPPPWPLISEHTETHIYTSIYIYIYI